MFYIEGDKKIGYVVIHNTSDLQIFPGEVLYIEKTADKYKLFDNNYMIFVGRTPNPNFVAYAKDIETLNQRIKGIQVKKDKAGATEQVKKHLSSIKKLLLDYNLIPNKDIESIHDGYVDTLIDTIYANAPEKTSTIGDA